MCSYKKKINTIIKITFFPLLLRQVHFTLGELSMEAQENATLLQSLENEIKQSNLLN